MVVLNRDYLIKKYGRDKLQELTSIDLNKSHINRIESNAFKGLVKLERLQLGYNEIEEIEGNVFESLSNLRNLQLYNNKLKRIDSIAFKGLSKLEHLDLSFNEMREIEIDLFMSLSNLKVLNLYKNKLKEIDRKCFEPLKKIQVIEITYNYDLNAYSFVTHTNKSYFKLLGVNYLSDWNEFLKQFPDQGISLNNHEENKDYNKYSKIESKRDAFIGEIFQDRYEIVKKLGNGTYGLVYLVNDIKNSEMKKTRQKAMKIMDRLDQTTENELNIFLEVVHENIVRYFDHFHMDISNDKHTCLITEYCENGDLKNQIEEAKRLNRNFSEKKILDWMCQATDALKYLHSKKPEPIIHRDIKPANMLLTKNSEIKLADLGLSKVMETTHASTYAGSPIYMSPEIFKAQVMRISYYPNTDIWSLGCVLYELIFLKFAFPKGQFGDPPIPSNIFRSGLFSSILPKMLENDCLVRITSKQLLSVLEKMSDDH